MLGRIDPVQRHDEVERPVPGAEHAAHVFTDAGEVGYLHSDTQQHVLYPTATQPFIPPGSVNEYQLRLGRQRQVWLIPIADERVGVQVKL